MEPLERTGRVAGKVCIVTGAGSGIGKAIAERLAEEGGRVLSADVVEESAARTASEIEAFGGEAVGFAVDVAVDTRVDDMVEAAVDRWGRVDVLVNNAGVNLPGRLHEVTDEVIDRTLDVNVKGQLYGCRAVIPHMLAQGGGSIVNIASVNGLVSEPLLTVYSASKGASVMLHQRGGARLCQAGDPLQRDLSRLGGHSDQLRPCRDARRPRAHVRDDRLFPAHRASGRAAGDCTRRLVPCLRRGQLHDRERCRRGRWDHCSMRRDRPPSLGRGGPGARLRCRDDHTDDRRRSDS